MAGQGPLRLHATAIQINNKGALIQGPSGSGKSSLALRLIALGGTLVGDDQVALATQDGRLSAQPVKAMRGLIEARGVGLLSVPYVEETKIDLIIDLTQEETERLPPLRYQDILGVTVPCLYQSTNPSWPEAIFLYLMGQRIDPDTHHVD